MLLNDQSRNHTDHIGLTTLVSDRTLSRQLFRTNDILSDVLVAVKEQAKNTSNVYKAILELTKDLSDRGTLANPVMVFVVDPL